MVVVEVEVVVVLLHSVDLFLAKRVVVVAMKMSMVLEEEVVVEALEVFEDFLDEQN